MSTPKRGQPDRNPSARPVAAGRQLTIGECIAISRYGQALITGEHGPDDLARVLEFIDEIRVCTTCGWSEALHVHNPRGVKDVNICAQFTR